MRRIAIVLIIVACSGGQQLPPPQIVASVLLHTADGSPPTVAALGAHLQLVAQAVDAAGKVVASAGIAFASADPAVATVDDAGLVTAVANGSAKITASSGGKSADLTVLVQQAPSSVAIVPAGGSLERGATLLLAASAVDANGHAISAAATWSSADSTIATVNASGTVTGVAIGSTSIVAAIGAALGSVTVQVVKPAVTTVQVAGTPRTLSSVDDTVQLSATALDVRGNPVEATAFSWESSAAGVVSVDAASGLAKAVSNGPATITATGGGQSGAIVITVQQSVAQVAVTGTPSTLTSLGDTVQLAAAPLDARGHAVANATVTWAICDGTAAPPCTATVAQVNGSGLVKALANGSAGVFATAGGVSGRFAITVAQAVDSVPVTPSTVTLAPTATQIFTAKALDKNLNVVAGAPAAAWSSSDAAVISIDPSSGNATVHATTVSTATIFASISGKQGTSAVTVDPNAKPVATITVSGSTTALASIGAQVQLTAVAKDSLGNVLTGVTFSWSPQASAIASVDSNGLVTANGNGTVTISASANGKIGTLDVTVLQQVSAVTAPTASPTLASIGDMVALTPRDAKGVAVGVPVTWSVTAGTSVTVDSASGVATAQVNGASTVAANNTSGATGAGASIGVTVAQAIHSISALDPGTVHAIGATVRMTALDARGNAVQASTITWTENSAGAVVTLAACTSTCTGAQEVATAVGNGASTVTAKTANDAGVTAGITVAQFVGIVSSSITPAKLRATGATLTLSAKDANGNAVAGAGFASGATGVAIVGVSSGVVTAVANGTATITATGASGDPGKTFDVTVSQQAAMLSAISTFTSINQTQQTTATDSMSHAIPANSLTWSACDGAATPPCTPTIVSVDATGTITAKANGSATVYAGVTGDVPASLGVTVAQSLHDVLVTPATKTIAVSATQIFSATPRDSGGTAIAGLGTPAWSSSDTGGAIATLATNGDGTATATGVSNGGPLTITATISTKSGPEQLTVTSCTPTSWTVTTPGFCYSFSGASDCTNQDPAITVCKGQTFTFHLSGVASFHPFCIWNAADHNDAPGVTNNCATGTTDVVWAVPANLTTGGQYMCSIHFFGNTFTVQ